MDCWGVRESDGGSGDVDFYSGVGVGWETRFEVEEEVPFLWSHSGDLE